MTSNAVPPSVTPPSPDEWPQNLVKTVTAISNASEAKVTCTAHGFTSADEGVTSGTFKQIVGMIPMNGQTALIQHIVDSDNFTINVNSNNYPVYRSGGVFIVDTGLPPVEQAGFQFFNTPFQNIATTN